MKKSISYTAYSTYVTCPKKYDLHYNEKLRPDSTPFSLVFGKALDQALNETIAGKDKEVAIQAASKELLRIFNERVSLEEKDYDGEIITEETSGLLFQKLRETGWEGQNTDALAKNLFDKISMGDTLSDGQLKAVKILIYFSSLEKVSLMVSAFEDYVLPQIDSIVSVQKNVKRGILDFEAKFKGIEGVVVCDNKTASRDYAEDAVRMSVQLAGYGAEKGCYIVFNKTVKKNRTKTCSICDNDGTGKRHKTCDAIVDGVRCGGDWDEMISPEVVPQIIIDEISKETRELVESAYSDTEKLIEAGVFPRNLNACGKQFGKPCEYINYCWNGDKKGLKRDEPTGRSD